MVWQLEFTPERLPRTHSPQALAMREHIKFVLGVVSDKGLSEVEFIVNPDKMMSSLSHMSQARAVRSGWAIEHAGQELDHLTFSGRSAACVVAGVGLVTACSKTYAQQSSLGRNVIDNMVLVYKDNGSVRNQDYPFVIDKVGHSFVRFDGVTYLGRFDELEITESQEQPFTVDFSFQFTVHREV